MGWCALSERCGAPARASEPFPALRGGAGAEALRFLPDLLDRKVMLSPPGHAVVGATRPRPSARAPAGDTLSDAPASALAVALRLRAAGATVPRPSVAAGKPETNLRQTSSAS